MKLSTIIPVCNEKETLPEIVEQVKKASLPLEFTEREIILVDDFSTDRSREFIESIDDEMIKKCFHDKNCGKGGALFTGFIQADGDVILIQDAHRDYISPEYARLLRPFTDKNAHMVFGSRFAGGGTHRVLFNRRLRGNRFLTRFSNILSGLYLTELESCCRVFRKDFLGHLTIEENSSGSHAEITARVADLFQRESLNIFEVTLTHSAGSCHRDKKRNWRDGILDLWCILKYNTSDLARFLRYQIFGIFVTLTQFLTIMILITLFDAKGVVYLENIFNLVATELSFLEAFQLHKIYTWRIKFHSWADALKNFLAFHAVSFLSFAIRLVLFYFFSRMGMDYRLNTLLGIPVSVVLNYIGYDRPFDKRSKRETGSAG